MTTKDPLFLKMCSDVDRLLLAGTAQMEALEICLDTMKFFVECGYVTDMAVKCLEEAGMVLIKGSEEAKKLGMKPPNE